MTEGTETEGTETEGTETEGTETEGTETEGTETEGTDMQGAGVPHGGGRDDLAPGGPRAMAQGCLCSVLANAAFRSGAAEDPIIDPRCPMHAAGER